MCFIMSRAQHCASLYSYLHTATSSRNLRTYVRACVCTRVCAPVTHSTHDSKPLNLTHLQQKLQQQKYSLHSTTSYDYHTYVPTVR